jgi:hypothetical protein
MSAKPYLFKQSDAERAVRAAKKAGLKVTGLHVVHDGVIVMVEGAEQSKLANPWDQTHDDDAGSAPPSAA